MQKIPILGELTPGTTQRHRVKLPGAALANDEPRPVISVAGAKPGPVLFVNAGVHGGEIVAQGTLADILAEPGSLTGQYLSGERRIPLPAKRRKGNGHAIVVQGARPVLGRSAGSSACRSAAAISQTRSTSPTSPVSEMSCR